MALILPAMLWGFPVQGMAAEDGLRDAMQAFGVQLPKERKAAPGFALKMAGGGLASLKDYRGRLVLLHFWATWCPPCRHEMPLLHRMDKRLADDGLSVVCVNVNRGDGQTVGDFMREVSPQFHTLLDPGGMVRNRYEVRVLPTSYLIAGDGRIIGRMVGERDWDGKAAISLFRRIAELYAEGR